MLYNAYSISSNSKYVISLERRHQKTVDCFILVGHMLRHIGVSKFNFGSGVVSLSVSCAALHSQ